MRTTNLSDACEYFKHFFNQLQNAHSDAINANNQFAEMVILSLLEDAAKMQNQLLKIKAAAE